MHLPHSPAAFPVRKQKGSPIDAQASFAVDPKSPSQSTHVDDDGSQTGSAVGHVDEEVHCTQTWVVVLQEGVVPEHCESLRQATQMPGVEAVAVQRAERH